MSLPDCVASGCCRAGFDYLAVLFGFYIVMASRAAVFTGFEASMFQFKTYCYDAVMCASSDCSGSKLPTHEASLDS